MRKEGADAEIWIDALYLRGVHISESVGGDETEADSLANQRQRDLLITLGRRGGLISNAAQVGGDLIGKHFFQSQPEQVRGAAAVRPGHNIASEARRAARTGVTTAAAIHQTGSDPNDGVDIAGVVANARALTLHPGKFALEQLAAAANRPEGIAVDNEQRRIGCVDVAAAGADLIR